MAKKIKSKESISENIANLLNAAPSGYGEDEEVDETFAKVTDNNDAYSEEGIGRSRFRDQNIDLLENFDNKYAGAVSTRKRLREETDESEEEFDQISEKDHSDDENTEGEDFGEEGSEADSGSASEPEDKTNFKHFESNNVLESMSKGLCVRNQLNMWESLLETRIQLQKSLSASNKFPIDKNFKELYQSNSDEFKNKLSETKTSIANILEKMLTLQTLVVQHFPETKKIFSENSKSKEKIKESDEEITSNEEGLSEAEEENWEHIVKKQRKNEEYEEIISKKQELYKSYRNKTIQKWNEKSRIGTLSKNTSNSQTILNQIDHIMSDKTKLIKKTQLKRSNYKIIGEMENEDETHNENIYDDDDFYHQLLRELIEFKSSDITDPVQLGRQWIQLQNMRSKMKRKIDTRATKGRKIRYAVHTKLINFMAPIDYRNTWTEEAKKELFGSIFGKKQI